MALGSGGATLTRTIIKTMLLTLTIANLQPDPGKIYLMGGGSTTTEVVQSFLKDCGSKDALILVFPQTRQEPWRGASSVELLAENGATRVTLLSAVQPTDAEKQQAADLLKQAKGIWIPGGDQSLLVDRWGLDWLKTNFSQAIKNGTNYFGTSAGAMVTSPTMITGYGNSRDEATTRPGLNLVPWIVDTHYAERKRQNRLLHALTETGIKEGLGLDEGDWIVFHDHSVSRSTGSPSWIDSRQTFY